MHWRYDFPCACPCTYTHASLERFVSHNTQQFAPAPLPCPRYTLSFIEAVRGVNRGDKVLQIGVGSGIKCGVNVWKVRGACAPCHTDAQA